MKALVLRQRDVYPELEDFPRPEAREGEQLVHIAAAALNHRDLWIVKGQYAGIRYPVILGSDGAGRLDDGREVIINPGMGWGTDERVQSRDFQILGLPANGTLAECVCVPEEQIYDKPAHLSMQEAAALPLAGLTAYRVLFSRCNLQPGEKVLISGVGGGVALLAFQMAKAAGAEVYVTSGSDEKLERAMQMGACGGANYRKENWTSRLKEQAGRFEVIIDSAGGAGLAALVHLAAPAGRIGIYGGTCGPITGLSPQVVFWRQLDILGSTMGSDKDFQNMLNFVNLHQLRPVVDRVFPLEQGADAFAYMDAGKQFGKTVVEVAD